MRTCVCAHVCAHMCMSDCTYVCVLVSAYAALYVSVCNQMEFAAMRALLHIARASPHIARAPSHVHSRTCLLRVCAEHCTRSFIHT